MTTVILLSSVRGARKAKESLKNRHTRRLLQSSFAVYGMCIPTYRRTLSLREDALTDIESAHCTQKYPKRLQHKQTRSIGAPAGLTIWPSAQINRRLGRIIKPVESKLDNHGILSALALELVVPCPDSSMPALLC